MCSCLDGCEVCEKPMTLDAYKSSKSTLIDLLAGALTDDIANWFKDWSGGDKLGLDSKTDIYAVVSKRLENGVEV